MVLPWGTHGQLGVHLVYAYLAAETHGSSEALVEGRRVYSDAVPSFQASSNHDQGSHSGLGACSYPVLAALACLAVVPLEASEKLAAHAESLDLAAGLAVLSK